MKIFKEIPTQKPITPILDNINLPSDIRSFSLVELENLANEIREFLLYSVGQSGGHLGGGLGVIELTIILHYILILLLIIWYGMLVIKPIHTKYLLVEKNEMQTIRKKVV